MNLEYQPDRRMIADRARQFCEYPPGEPDSTGNDSRAYIEPPYIYKVYDQDSLRYLAQNRVSDQVLFYQYIMNRASQKSYEDNWQLSMSSTGVRYPFRALPFVLLTNCPGSFTPVGVARYIEGYTLEDDPDFSGVDGIVDDLTSFSWSLNDALGVKGLYVTRNNVKVIRTDDNGAYLLATDLASQIGILSRK